MGLNNIIGATRFNEGMDLARRVAAALEALAIAANRINENLVRLTNELEREDR